MSEKVPFDVDCKYCSKSYVIKANKDDMDSWLNGEGYIQDILAYLSAADRELLISGTCDDCWNNMFGSDEDEDDEDDEEEYENVRSVCRPKEAWESVNGDSEDIGDKVGMSDCKHTAEWDNNTPSASWCKKCGAIDTNKEYTPVLEHQCADGNSGTFVIIAYSSSEGVLVKCLSCEELFKVCNEI